MPEFTSRCRCIHPAHISGRCRGTAEMRRFCGPCMDTEAIDVIDTYPGEICRRCAGRVIAVWKVPDDIWNAVVRDRWNVLCPSCFDIEAHIADVRYTFASPNPISPNLISWSEWTS